MNDAIPSMLAQLQNATEYNKLQTVYKEQQQMLGLHILRNLHVLEYYGI